MTTPAIASVPYWAAAPSVSTSTWSMAATGMKLRSTVAEPEKELPESTARLDESCRRLPSISTRVSFGPRPRNAAWMLSAAMSPPVV